jgi:hypothetical protein
VGPRAGLDGWKISSPTVIRSRTVQPVVSKEKKSYGKLKEIAVCGKLALEEAMDLS